ncbi:MAG: substrate-binding domain-containing protein, partial [Acidimicrobiia bacterium]
MRRLAGSILLALVAACSPGQERVVVAAGTTIVDSGLLDVVAARYEDEHSDVRLSVVGDATARVLELGRRGAADLLLTHAPRAEAEFVADGLAVAYEQVFTSRFVLVGPPDRVGDLAG